MVVIIVLHLADYGLFLVCQDVPDSIKVGQGVPDTGLRAAYDCTFDKQKYLESYSSRIYTTHMRNLKGPGHESDKIYLSEILVVRLVQPLPYTVSEGAS